jgi:hypothetical protein
MDIGVKGWALIAVGVVAGVALTLLSTAVRDAVLDAFDAVAYAWWRFVDWIRGLLIAAGLLLMGGLAMWAVAALLLPRLASE